MHIPRSLRIVALANFCLVGIIAGLSVIGLYVTDRPQGILKIDPCYNGRRVVFVAGINKNTGFLHEAAKWGPPYFRMSMTILAWPGGAFSYNWNSAGVCEISEDEKLYHHKETWIETHDAEWQAWIKEHPEDGKFWYGDERNDKDPE